MAERRMFSKAVIHSARFLRMPPSSRLLYYDLGMSADDDGVVEAFTVMRTTGATEDDLRVLVSKGFITVLNDDLVSFINDWKRNNLIKKDRYHESIYAQLLVQRGPQAEHNRSLPGTVMEPEVSQDQERSDQSSSVEGMEGQTGTNPPTAETVRQYMNNYALSKGLVLNAAISAERFFQYNERRGWDARDWTLFAREWVEKDARSGAVRCANPALNYEQRSDTDYSGCIIDLSTYPTDG